MIERYKAIWVALGLLLSFELQAAPPAPAPIPGGLETEMDLRLFLKKDELNLFFETMISPETDQRQQVGLTLGGYYRVLENLKLGAFYRRSYGIRHDEDWVNPGTGWIWNNTNSRGEDLIILDATPRFHLSSILGESWVGEIKTRYFYNAFNRQSSFRVRPGITFFWLRDDQPFLSFFLQFELMFPAGFGVQSIYEKWLYIGTNYHVLEHFDVAVFGAIKWETWGNTSDFINLGGSSYVFTTQTFVLGLTGIFQFDL